MWHGVIDLRAKSYICGHCGNPLSSARGYYEEVLPDRFIYICHHCGKPTYFAADEQVPGTMMGVEIRDVPADVGQLYQEARKSFSVGAYTAAVMACRKLIMHIGVTKGAEAGLSFMSYIEFLDSAHYIPPDGKGWVDHIRIKGNEANHEIVIMGQADAEDLIVFIEMLLKFIFEFPGRTKPKTPKPPMG